MQKKNKIKNLLHQGREVQEGREVQAVQAGRAYHRYQGDQEDPAKKNQTKKSEIRQNQKQGYWMNWMHRQRDENTTCTPHHMTT